MNYKNLKKEMKRLKIISEELNLQANNLLTETSVEVRERRSISRNI